MSLYQFVPTPETTRFCLQQIELPDTTISQIGELSSSLDVNLEQVIVRAISLLHEEFKLQSSANEGDKSTNSQLPMPTGFDRDH